MPRPLPDIAADMDRLTSADFDLSFAQADGAERLRVLIDELRDVDDVQSVAEVAFALMERLPDADLGTSGPLVHELERRVGYEPFLEASIQRRPTPLAVWMVNRIVNAGDPEGRWRDLLRLAVEHPLASEVAREDASDFLHFQEGK
jgi:hypothetical protein